MLNPYGLICGGLFLLITVALFESQKFWRQIADQEIARKAEILKTLDYLCQQLGELDVTNILPDEVERHDVVINRAIDVRIACMRYLASHISHDATRLGTIGNILAGVVNWSRESDQEDF